MVFLMDHGSNNLMVVDLAGGSDGGVSSLSLYCGLWLWVDLGGGGDGGSFFFLLVMAWVVGLWWLLYGWWVVSFVVIVGSVVAGGAENSWVVKERNRGERER